MKLIVDPIKKEILKFLSPSILKLEADEFDIEGAIYWFAYDYHGGQWSSLYSTLSTSPFRPGPLSKGPDGEICHLLYQELVNHYFPSED